MRLKRLTSKDEDCWRDLPAVRRSIEEAAVHFGQTSVGDIVDRVVANFVTDGHAKVPLDQQNMTAVWYLVEDDGTVRGHLLAFQNAWDGKPCIYVDQAYGRNTPKDLQLLAAEELDHYTRSRGCQDIYMYTRRPSRFWSKRFGFEMVRFLYRRRLTP